MKNEATAGSGSADAGADLVLHASDLTLRFGGLTVLDKVDVRMRRGEVLAVIGPNGAGKTSLFNSLTGAYTAGGGRSSSAPRTATRSRCSAASPTSSTGWAWRARSRTSGCSRR
ncbi:ATP-binding cassette domain-containing protein [Streptomyces zhihengii]